MAGRIAYYGNIVRDGLVLDLDAAKRDSYPGSGTVWRDIAGGVITGSLINGPIFDPNNGGSIVFDGSNDYVNCGNIMPISAYTKCVFFNISNLGSPNNLISGASNGTHYFYPGGGSYLRAGHFQGAEVVSNTPIVANQWYHGVITFSISSGFVIYQNGVVVGTNASTATFTGGNVVYVGAYEPTGNLLTGRIAIAQIYNRVLSQSEVLQNYNATKTRFGL